MSDTQKLLALRVVVATSIQMIRKTVGGRDLWVIAEALKKALEDSKPSEHGVNTPIEPTHS